MSNELPDLGSRVEVQEKPNNKKFSYFSSFLSPTIEKLQELTPEDVSVSRKGVIYAPKTENVDADYTLKANKKGIFFSQQYERNNAKLDANINYDGEARVNYETNLFGGRARLGAYKGKDNNRGLSVQFEKSW